jgi:hypothetical protein
MAPPFKSPFFSARENGCPFRDRAVDCIFSRFSRVSNDGPRESGRWGENSRQRHALATELREESREELPRTPSREKKAIRGSRGGKLGAGSGAALILGLP